MKRFTKMMSLLAAVTVLALSLLPMAALAATPAEIVAAAYALQPGEVMEGAQTLTGKIINVDTPYNSGYKNITVTIEVKGCEDKPIMCYRLKGTGADVIAVGDTITVTGTVINYQHTSGDTELEFDAGSMIIAHIPAEPTTPETPTEKPEFGVVDSIMVYDFEDGAMGEVNTEIKTQGDVSAKFVYAADQMSEELVPGSFLLSNAVARLTFNVVYL